MDVCDIQLEKNDVVISFNSDGVDDVLVLKISKRDAWDIADFCRNHLLQDNRKGNLLSEESVGREWVRISKQWPEADEIYDIWLACGVRKTDYQFKDDEEGGYFEDTKGFDKDQMSMTIYNLPDVTHFMKAKPPKGEG